MALRNKVVLIRKTGVSVATVAAALVTVEITEVPIRGRIHRIRVSATGTDAPNLVRASVYQQDPGVVPTEPIRVKVPWALSPAEDDHVDQYYQIARSDSTSPHGSLWITCSTNHVTADHTITIELDIEALAFA